MEGVRERGRVIAISDAVHGGGEEAAWVEKNATHPAVQFRQE